MPTREPHYRMTCRSRWLLALLSLSVVLLAPFSGRAGAASDSPPAQPADFQAIDAYVADQMRAMHVPGVALGIVQGDRIVHLQGFGVANPAGQRMTAQTPLILGSTSKSFTALAVMQLVEAGKISLDAPVQHYLPWFQVGMPSDPAAASTITVRHLLNHVSGIPTRALAGANLAGTGDETIEQAVRALRGVALSAPIGTTYQYSNLNYATLGLIVQTVSGQPYEAYVQQHIFLPLQMEQSFVSQSEALRHGMATGYRWWFGRPIPSHLPYLRAGLPDGYLISSAQDMAQYLVAQLNDGRYLDASVLSPDGIAQMHAPAAPMTPGREGGAAYGMGWVIDPSDEPAIWHGGDTANFHSDLIMLPQRRIGVVVLMNVNGDLAIRTGAEGVIVQGVQRLLLGQQSRAGSPFWRQYLVFDASLVLCSALALWSLVRLLCGRDRPMRRPLDMLTRLVLPLLWEVALPLWLVIGFPALVQVTWPVTLRYFPDLGYWLLALCVLLLATGNLRLLLAGTTLYGVDLGRRSRHRWISG